jgi:hypothetical protein
MEEIKSKKDKKRERERERSGDSESSKKIARIEGTSLADDFSSSSSPILKRRDLESDDEIEIPRSGSRGSQLTSSTNHPSGIATTVLSKQIDIISKFTVENFIDLETKLNNSEANSSCLFDHFDYMTPTLKSTIKLNLIRAYRSDSSYFGKLNPNDFEKWSREELFSLLKRIAPSSEGQISGLLSVRDQFGALKLKFHVTTGINPVHEFVDKVLTLKETYANEVEKDERQLIKIIIKNLPDSNKVERRYKNLLQTKEHASVEDLLMDLLDEGEKLINAYIECSTYLGMTFETATDSTSGSAFSKSSENSDTMGTACNGCGWKHPGRKGTLKSHPNYYNDESTSWRDNTSGKLLLAKGERRLPWDKYLQDSNSDTFTKWTKAPEKPTSKKLKT